MILFTLAGLGVHYFLDVKLAVPAGVLLGFVVANLVPAKAACGLEPRAETEAEEHEEAGVGG